MSEVEYYNRFIASHPIKSLVFGLLLLFIISKFFLPRFVYLQYYFNLSIQSVMTEWNTNTQPRKYVKYTLT